MTLYYEIEVMEHFISLFIMSNGKEKFITGIPLSYYKAIVVASREK
jgi:hypothetical protein